MVLLACLDEINSNSSYETSSHNSNTSSKHHSNNHIIVVVILTGMIIRTIVVTTDHSHLGGESFSMCLVWLQKADTLPRKPSGNS